MWTSGWSYASWGRRGLSPTTKGIPGTFVHRPHLVAVPSPPQILWPTGTSFLPVRSRAGQMGRSRDSMFWSLPGQLATNSPFVYLGTSFPPGPPLVSVTLKAPTRVAQRCIGCCALSRDELQRHSGREAESGPAPPHTYIPVRSRTTVLPRPNSRNKRFNAENHDNLQMNHSRDLYQTPL